MEIFKLLVGFVIVAAFLYWVIQFFFLIRMVKVVPVLEKLKHEKLSKWPRISVITTACNEAENLEEAMKSKLKDDYPDCEFILVNDRSTDETGAIVKSIAAKDSRVKAIHIKELPEGWLGKIHAMNEGLRVATGDWILFSDADVHIKKGTLRKVISYVERESIDHLTVAPELWAPGFLLDTVFSVFERMLCFLGRIWAVNEPESKAVAGAGAFNLVRRLALEKTKGLEWLRLEVIDDLALGMMLKRSGARSVLVNGRDYVGVHFYKSLKDAARGAERATFTAMGNFSFFRVFLWCIFLLFEMTPFFVLFSGVSDLFWLLGLVTVGISIAASVMVHYWWKHSFLPSIFWPVGSLLTIINFLRAGYLGAMRGGIFWRGTFYPTSLLRKGKRYELF